MFTGIVQAQGLLTQIIAQDKFSTHTVKLPEDVLGGLTLGASVAHNGCCLTVTKIAGDLIDFDLMQQTLRLTNLGQLTVGDLVNIERAAKFGDEIGGHAMSGHIMCMVEIMNIIRIPNNQAIYFKLPAVISKFVFSKGYIGIDGISLTVSDVTNDSFCVHLIPETLARTNLGTRIIGDWVNIEIDPQTQAIVETVERILKNKLN